MNWDVVGMMLLGAGIPWCIWVTWQLRSGNQVRGKLLEMHEHPENTGFGTVGFRHLIEDNTRAVRELSHYVRWSTEAQTGRIPPPFVGSRE